jgi:hypothetical protein
MTLTTVQLNALKKLYYTEGFAVGRDKLYYELKQRLPVHFPAKHEINSWLKNKELISYF